MTLLYKCPSCSAMQRHGGTCDRCGVDFAKYAAMMIAQEQNRVQHKRDKARANASTWKQIILLPLTGGYSLMRFLLRREN